MDNGFVIEGAIRPQVQIAELAARQHGVVSRRQLLGHGLGAHAIKHRLATGGLHIIHRGVYAVGHRSLTREGRWVAATLAVGGVLSHRSAAALWGIAPTSRTRIDVTVGGSLRQRPGLELHFRDLAADERATERGIPVTAPTRTLFDLAAVVNRANLERAIEQVDVIGLAGGPTLTELIDRHANHRGGQLLREVLADRELVRGVGASELEDLFQEFLAEHDLPRPERNAAVEAGGQWFEVDCLWRDAALIVELDGRRFHATDGAFERDRERDRLLQAAGWRVVRITWAALHDRPATIARDLGWLLSPDKLSAWPATTWL